MSQVNQRQRVLVTALGTMNCTTIVRELRKMPDNFYIIGADINPANRIYTSMEVDEYYQFPKATDNREDYFNFVLSFCIEHKVDIYYCVVDEEVETMALHREQLAAKGVTLCVANTDAIVICHNKDKFAQWSEAIIPEYCIRRYASFNSVTDKDFPLFVKPIEGRASIGCKRIDNQMELSQYKDEWNNYVVQEFTEGKIVAVDVVRCKTTGLTQICQRLELLRNGNGCGIAVQIINNEDVKSVCLKIAETLDLNGVINVEFFVTERGLKVIEVNPRIPAGVAYSCMAGLNIVEMALRIASGIAISEPSVIRYDTFFAKRYETYEVCAQFVD